MPATDYTPTSTQVAAILHARTVDVNGAELGAFSSETRPTDDQVDAMCTLAAQELESDIGSDINSELFDNASSLASYKAAMLVELSFFPEQIERQQSPYQALERLYDKGLARLISSVQEVEEGGEIGAIDDLQIPIFGFPADEGGLIGWQTEW